VVRRAFGHVNAGSDLRVMGNDAQPVYVRTTDNTTNARRFAGWLRNGAVATAGAGELVQHRTDARVIADETCSALAPRCALGKECISKRDC